MISPRICILMMVLGAVFPAGCAIKTADISYHSFHYPSPVKEAEAPVPDTLMVYRFLLARSVPMDSLVIVQSSGGEQAMIRYRWEENPADMISELVMRDLQSSGIFQRTVDQLSSLRYRYALEGSVKALHGLEREGKAFAVLEIEVVMTDFEAPVGSDKNIMTKRYAVQAPAESTSPESMIQALNAAIRTVSEKLRGDIRTTFQRPAIKGERRTPHEDTPQRRAPTLEKRTIG